VSDVRAISATYLLVAFGVAFGLLVVHVPAVLVGFLATSAGLAARDHLRKLGRPGGS
jgi:hypothetical protein